MPKKQRQSKLESPVVSNKVEGKGTPKQPALFKLPGELLDSVRPPLLVRPPFCAPHKLILAVSLHADLLAGRLG